MLTDLIEALQAEGVDMSWQDFANCRGADPDLFFPERGASTRTAKQICRECTVLADCLEFAIVSSEKFGIWGAMSERERRKIRRERQIAASHRQAG
ncbi:MAG: WhiB family transcriptional regulator [Acidimicrobiia bacterium]|nr:MAG: WhiB family transcriptional regulator [Acidimicrobiia bacterium]